jgi:hypothetical protein
MPLPHDSLLGTLIAGVALTLALAAIARALAAGL